MGKHAFINADGVLTSWGYQESNNDDTKIEVDDTFHLECGKWQKVGKDWVEYKAPTLSINELADKVTEELKLEPRFHLIFEAMFRMENRIRVLEGKQAISKEAYWTAVKQVFKDLSV